jgi:hypothetical protein
MTRGIAWSKDDPFGAEFAEVELAGYRLVARGLTLGSAPAPVPGSTTPRLRPDMRPCADRIRLSENVNRVPVEHLDLPFARCSMSESVPQRDQLTAVRISGRPQARVRSRGLALSPLADHCLQRHLHDVAGWRSTP